jgi:SAM-dependent methyltransferase
MGRKLHLVSKRFSRASVTDAEKLTNYQIKARDEVATIISDGETWKFNSRECQNCSSTNFKIIAEVDRYLLDVETVICLECGFMFTDPVMRQEDYLDFYTNYYRKLYTNSSQATEEFFLKQVKTGQRIYKYLRKNFDIENKVVVEIGAGAGGILKAFLENGNSVIGCDFGDEYLNYGIQNGIDLRSGGIQNIPSNSADVVIYCHVLEHILDLSDEFENLKRILRPGGVVYVEVPGIFFIHYTYRGNFLRFLQNAHLYHFSKKSLIALMSKYGFQPIVVNQVIHGLFKLDFGAQPISKKSNVNITYLYLKVIEYLRPVLNLPWKIYDKLSR